MGVKIKIGAAAAAFAICMAPAGGWATLGQPAQSVDADQQKMRAQRHSETAAGYTVQVLADDERRQVREFVSLGGMVFGVAWRGPQPPDLAMLLGAYAASLRQGLPGVVRGQGQAHLEAGDLVVDLGGHPRDLRGRAYLKSLMPAGVSPEVVQ